MAFHPHHWPLMDYLDNLSKLDMAQAPGQMTAYHVWLRDRSMPVLPIPVERLSGPSKKSLDRLLKRWQPQVKACYENALTVSRRTGADYVLGYALNYIPMTHAWNFADGQHFDVTADLALKAKFQSYMSCAIVSGAEAKDLLEAFPFYDMALLALYQKEARHERQ